MAPLIRDSPDVNLVEGLIATGPGKIHIGNNYTQIDDKSSADKCMADLFDIDPRIHKKMLEKRKGGLLKECYEWILDNAVFQKWLTDPESRLLWVRGAPGKGKTMLMCGLIEELACEVRKTNPIRGLAYFFCQATEVRLNNGVAVLRGLIYMLVEQHPALISYLRKSYDHKGKAMFEGLLAWVTLSEILEAMLDDEVLEGAVLLVDALDECTADTDRSELLDLIKKPSRVKWIVSSRDWSEIEEKFRDTEQHIQLRLELNQASISDAVLKYIHSKVNELARIKDYSGITKKLVQNHLTANANGTFLWVALACQVLGRPDTQSWNVSELIETIPSGLFDLYRQMLKKVEKSWSADRCKEILAIASTVYRPIALEELSVLSTKSTSLNTAALEKLTNLCGSFLTLSERRLYFVHQSAKDFLITEASGSIFPFSMASQHNTLFLQSLSALSNTLRQDMYGLRAPGMLSSQVTPKTSALLAPIRYSCVYWVDHLCDSANKGSRMDNLHDGGALQAFFENKYLYWLEALSLLKFMSEGVIAVQRLAGLEHKGRELSDLIGDALRFILAFKYPIEIAPLQTYAAALVFSPSRSKIRNLFAKEAPMWIKATQTLELDWSSRIQTLETISAVFSVAFSPDGSQLAAGLQGNAIEIWNTESWKCTKTLNGHEGYVSSIVFLSDCRLASGSKDSTVNIWNTASGECMTLRGHSKKVSSLTFSSGSEKLASGSRDMSIKLWDIASGKCTHTLKGHKNAIDWVAFSQDGNQLASCSTDKTIKIWTSEECTQSFRELRSTSSVDLSPDGTLLALGLVDNTIAIWNTDLFKQEKTLEGHTHRIDSVVFSPDSKGLASGSNDGTVKLWNLALGKCTRTLGGHSQQVGSLAFSPNGKQLASGSFDRTVQIWDTVFTNDTVALDGHSELVSVVVFSPTAKQLATGSNSGGVKIWDTDSGKRSYTLTGHSKAITKIVFSSNGTLLASASYDSTVIISDTAARNGKTLKGHKNWVLSIVFSPDGKRLVSGSFDRTIKIWNTASGDCERTLKGHTEWVTSIVFSMDGRQLASGSGDHTVKIWNTASWECRNTLKGHNSVVRSVVFSPGGNRLLASGDNDGTVKIWDAALGFCKMTLPGHERRASSMVFSADGSKLALGLRNNTVKIWNTATGECEKVTENYTCWVKPDVFSHNGKQEDNTAKKQESCLQLGISADMSWITQDEQNVLWLPARYRPMEYAISGHSVAISCSSGRVFLLKFDRAPTKIASTSATMKKKPVDIM